MADAFEIWVLTGDHAAFDATKPGGIYSATDLELHRQMRAALESLDGYQFEFFSNHEEFLRRALAGRPDMVLNFCDTGLRNVAVHELHIPALLDIFGIPCSGAPPAAMVLCYDKALVRLAAQELGIAVPRQFFLPADAPFRSIDVKYPALIKPNRADGSVGITRDSLVSDEAEAQACIGRLRAQLPGCEILVQEYLPGPEYGLALIGNEGQGFSHFPPLTVDFGKLPDDFPPILGYESKTDPDSPYWKDVGIKPAELDSDIVERLLREAKALFARLQCRDYARFDYRTGADGEIKLLEVNPNPAWDSSAKLALMAGFAGKSYADMMRLLIETARRRVQAG